VRETSERRERYKLDVPRPGNVAVDQRVVALYENAAKLAGIEGPTNELVGWLNGEEKQLKVVSIVGFGGLGKTTLANRVYHKLDGEFQCGAFVPVSQKPNMSKLLHSLLTQIGCGQSFHDCELNVLLDQVRENLKNKRYFFLLCILLLFTSSSDTWIVLKIFNIMFFYRELIFNLIKKYFLLP
jgi:disease resistance protein RPM1